MKFNYRGVICLSLLLLTGTVSPLSANVVTAMPVDQEDLSDSFVASNIKVGKLFDAVAERLNKPIILSKLAAEKKVTGNFNLANADEMFKALARRMALVWYDDGASIYVYDNSEMRSVIVHTQAAGSAQVLNYIQKTGIFDKRFPVRTQGDNRLLFVSGPPLYVELISAAAAYLDERIKREDLAGGEVAVIPLKHSSVTDRTYSQRGQTITIPGMLSSLNALFQGDNGASENNLTIHPKENEAKPIEAGFPLPPSIDGGGDLARKTVNSSARKSPFSLVAYPDSNSLVVKGSPDQIRYVRQLVQTLDNSRSQVELSLWIIDVVRSKVDDLGVRWEVGNLGVGGGAVTFNRSTLTDSKTFLAQIDAISKSGNARIVSRPVILTQENVPALFDNNTSFYTRVEGERVATLEQVTYGTMINVLPRLSAGNSVEMEVNIEDGGLSRDKSGKVSDVEGLPQVNRTNINTVARIGRDNSLLIGGYTRDQIEDNESQVPLLGDIPVLGNLFKYRAHNQQKMIRIFLIQPRILDENESWDGRQFSENERLNRQDSQLSGTVKFLQDYISQPWQ
ncbi:type III secretion system outer membrane ring subunit SctC [Yersinia enterocolitica]|jgi:type II secretory pathway component GspD/PulD (secretin)|uniref:Type 3 secretion system secretin n=2 Tax=Yersinia TaxID=629 RepID=A0AAI8ZQU8_YERFR|nr:MULTISPECIES: type III secretion system outer membrane ring subunit SctC [Yersinia]ATM88346.1 EscC/YscC/HrcC family type III secretion system outer membrane ring protein [Yersinia frederiksenii]AVX39884.1 EscC/YscC/HrcC family type III secretion system outer membrane ring protein [Yersinia massiliensis]MCB5316996.1 type III secretion system outer membrane ring subunit SctC [Yersinia massiliensis]MDN0126121.1 type III secretion system outer membrane ring subunit SctC [Yersinia massiliensis]Q